MMWRIDPSLASSNVAGSSIDALARHHILQSVSPHEETGYGIKDYMYYVWDARLGIASLEEICDDDKVDDMLDHIANRGQNIVNLTVVRGSESTPADLNIGYICDEQVPMANVGESSVYEVNDASVLYKSPYKVSKTVDVDMEQEELERSMEHKRRSKIQRFKKYQKTIYRVHALKRKLPLLLTEDDSELEEDEDFMDRMVELRRQREDPLLHFEGDTDVEEPYELEEEEVQEEHAKQDKHGEMSMVPEEPNRNKLMVRKGPTTSSHASDEQQFEDVWIPSSNEDDDPGDLMEEEVDGVVPLPFLLDSVDGCFIKLSTGQQILAATRRDGNNNIHPIAFGVVDKEGTNSWTWFLIELKTTIGGEAGRFDYYTIISDKKKGLLKAVSHGFPNCNQRFCLRHIYQNF
ncbi:MATE efflux family protein 3, chloroplastic [Hordeum vulgare]|nr:MATE efflux family protein 3, chloroplastic [Hordeum vulgare]